MTLAPRQLAMSAALGFALASVPMSPAQAQGSDAPAKQADLDDLKLQIANLKKDLEKAQRDAQRDLQDQLYGKQVDGRTIDGVYGRLDKRITNVEESLKRIEDQLSKLSKSTSSFTPQGPTSTHGYVRIVNSYPVDVSIMLNGKSYRMTPDEVRTVEVPVGSYTYELLGSGSPATTSTVRNNETVTLRIR